MMPHCTLLSFFTRLDPHLHTIPISPDQFGTAIRSIARASNHDTAQWSHKTLFFRVLIITSNWISMT